MVWACGERDGGGYGEQGAVEMETHRDWPVASTPRAPWVAVVLGTGSRCATINNLRTKRSKL